MPAKKREIDALNDMMSFRKGVAITPADGTDLPNGVCDGIYVGTAGNINMMLEDDTAAVLYTGITVGFHRVRVKRVLATTTTAALMRAMY
jgi:hypothetical protein